MAVNHTITDRKNRFHRHCVIVITVRIKAFFIMAQDLTLFTILPANVLANIVEQFTPLKVSGRTITLQHKVSNLIFSLALPLWNATRIGIYVIDLCAIGKDNLKLTPEQCMWTRAFRKLILDKSGSDTIDALWGTPYPGIRFAAVSLRQDDVAKRVLEELNQMNNHIFQTVLEGVPVVLPEISFDPEGDLGQFYGMTIESIEVGGISITRPGVLLPTPLVEDTMELMFSNGTTLRFYHDQDCCESVGINDIIGDLGDLIGLPLTQFEAVSNHGTDNGSLDDDEDDIIDVEEAVDSVFAIGSAALDDGETIEPEIVTTEVSTEVKSPQSEFPGALNDHEDSWTWTFYKLATNKGSVTVRWYGSSNGYYSESVDIKAYTSWSQGFEIKQTTTLNGEYVDIDPA